MEQAPSKQRRRENFKDSYEHLCAMQNSCPLAAITANLQEDFIDCNADRIRLGDWTPVIDSLKTNNSLRFIAFRSFWQQNSLLQEGASQHRAYILRKRTPAIRSRDVTSKICRSLKELLSTSSCIECLILQGIPVRERDLQTLAKGIVKSKTLRLLSLESSRIGDDGLEAIAAGLKKSISLKSVSLSSCALSWRGMETISDIITHQATQRHGEAWQESLRYRRPDLNRMHGLRRINLSQNTLIGDRGVQILADALKDDLWVKALDLQQCGMSMQGADALLTALDFNKSIRVLDVRLNPLLDRDKVKAVLEKVMLNSGGEDPEYPWLTVKEQTEVKKRKLNKKPIRFTLNRSISKAQRMKSKHRSNRPKKYEADDNPDPLVTSDTYVPWRTTARLQRNKYKTRNPIKSSPTDDLTSQPLRTVAEEKGAKDRTIIAGVGELSIEELGAEERYLDRKDIKELKVELTGLKRRYGNEVRQRAEIESRLREVEVENRKLKNEIVLLKSNGMVPKHSSVQNHLGLDALEDDNVLENIEASFRQFQKFLDLIKNTDLADLYRLLEERPKLDS
eukprot:Seg224.7 transcript_id=Seg224.7/GoldUCD/mRNA.D3Y31 product="Centrosomal protein of 78 kDa" protein_id=Seg224.7/GoldUCD/D3Y31